MRQEKAKGKKKIMTLGRIQLSVENMKIVRTFISHLKHIFTIVFSDCMPAVCPSDSGNPLIFAHLPFPSIITATCFGIISFLNSVCVSSTSSKSSSMEALPSALSAFGIEPATVVPRLIMIMGCEGSRRDWEREAWVGLVVVFGGQVISVIGGLNDNMVFLSNLLNVKSKLTMKCYALSKRIGCFIYKQDLFLFLWKKKKIDLSPRDT